MLSLLSLLHCKMLRKTTSSSSCRCLSGSTVNAFDLHSGDAGLLYPVSKLIVLLAFTVPPCTRKKGLFHPYDKPQYTSYTEEINLVLRSSLFSHTTQRRSVVSCRRFETTYRFHLQAASSPVHHELLAYE
jgi:hypothetical protein